MGLPACCAQELKGYLRQGITLDELWRVARGEVKYADFAASRQGGAQQGGNGAAIAAPPSIPDELARPCCPVLPGCVLHAPRRSGAYTGA